MKTTVKKKPEKQLIGGISTYEKKNREKLIDDISIYERKTIWEIFHLENDIEIHVGTSNPMLE